MALRFYQKKKIHKRDTLHPLCLSTETILSMLATQEVTEVQRSNAQIHVKGVRIAMAMQSNKEECG